MLFEPAQHTDMGQPTCAAAAERHIPIGGRGAAAVGAWPLASSGGQLAAIATSSAAVNGFRTYALTLLLKGRIITPGLFAGGRPSARLI